MQVNDEVIHGRLGRGKIIQQYTESWFAVLFEDKEATRSGDGYETCHEEFMVQV